jgi:AcrR family transcriptional regulator
MARPSDPSAKIDLLRAAETVFVERGLDHTKVEDITARAGRGKGSFYLHFQSKEEAFRQIVETMLARLATYIDDDPVEVASSDPTDVADYLSRWHDKDLLVFEFAWQNRGLMRLCLGGGRSADFGYLIDAFAERSRANIRKALERGMALGVFHEDLDVELTSLVIAGAYDRVARQLVRLDKKPDLRRWLAEVQRLVLTGIGGPALTEVLAKRQTRKYDQPVTNTRNRARPNRIPPHAPLNVAKTRRRGRP